jgi:ADP-heptose:LPS heptosyltransferase
VNGSPPTTILIHPGSGSPHKNLPAAQLAPIVEAIARQLEAPITLLCGPDDEQSTADLLAHLARPLPVERPSGLTDLTAHLRRARLYLGHDSGVSHLAAGLGVPTVAIFGPTDPRRWAPRGPRVAVLAPATPGPMPEDAPTIPAVLNAINQLLGPIAPNFATSPG